MSRLPQRKLLIVVLAVVPLVVLVGWVALTTSASTASSARVCSAFSQLVEDTHRAMVEEQSPVDVVNRVGGIHRAITDDPPMKRAAKRLFYATWGGARSQNRFSDGIIAARQLSRLCEADGHKAASVQPDVIMEYACTGSFIASKVDEEQLSPVLAGVYFKSC